MFTAYIKPANCRVLSATGIYEGLIAEYDSTGEHGELE